MGRGDNPCPRQVNDRLVKLKQEKEMSTDETPYEELYPLHSSFDALSQIMPGQQFFQDINNELANMPRTE